MEYNTKFKINQQIVYPSQGVGKITEIFEKKFNDKTMLYYKVYLEVSDMVVMVPVEKAEELGIRSIVSKEEAEAAINILSDNSEPITSDWKLRYQMNLELLKKGTIADIAKIVWCLYNRSKVKELPILERKLYDNAKKLLEDEISFAMEISAKEAESLIHAKLEPPGSTPAPKRNDFFDDDDDDEFDSEDSRDSTGDSDDDDDDDDVSENSRDSALSDDDDDDDDL